VVVYCTEAERPIAVQYARQSRTGVSGVTNTYLPIRVTQAGVMPIIFALSLFSFPQLLATLFSAPQYVGTWLGTGAEWITAFFNNEWLYGALYFVLVFVFTFFYTAFVFEPETISENLQKGGGFIPGIRPGKPTTEHIGNIVSRVTFVGAFFFAVVAVLPVVLQGLTGTQSLALGGTALLIVVSVLIDVIKKVNAQLSMREYI
jgi:preprotein translocase subunit SecY